MSTSSDAAQAANDPGPAGAARRPERKSLGKYEIQKKIGAGGMGTVFLAIDSELRRTVALKILPRERAQNPMLVRRFKSEGQAAAHLRHENLVSVFEAGEIDGYLYIALEYVDGIDVHHLVEKRGVVPVKRSIAIVRQVARALEHACEQNIVHRDIKPSNLLIQRDGSVKLTDFGLARSLDEETETGITRAGTTVGTVDYMSPEQARDSKSADIRSDIYSLGCSWYHMLAGEPPYPDGAVTNKLQAHASAPPPDPRDKNSSVPEGVVAIIHRMMAKDPDARYQTPKELLEDLDSTILSRQTLSTNVLAALAEGDSEATARPARKPGAAAPPAASAQPIEARPGVAAPLARSTLDPELIKYAVAVAIVLAVLALVWWIVSQFASTMETPSNTTNPFALTDDVPRQKDAQVAGQTSRGPGDPPPSESPPTEQPTQPVEPMASGEPHDEPGNDETVETRAAAGETDAAAVQQAAASPSAGSWSAAIPLRTGEQPPDWVRAADELARYPLGSNGEPLPVLTVGRGDGEPSQFARLESALARVPRTGGVLKLTGPGPFELTPTRIAIDGPLVLEAAPGPRPLVMLLPNRDGTAGRVLQVEGATVSLVGVDFVAVGRQFPASQPLALIEILGGDLVVRGCSATLLGARAGPTAAFRTLDRPAPDGGTARADPPRTLLDRVFVRGNGLSALALARAHGEVVVSNGLLVAGEAPVFSISHSPADPPASGPPDAPPRSVRLFSTTAVTAHSGFFLEHARGVPPDTLVALANSVVAAPPGADSAALVELGEWPGTGASAGPLITPRNLKFTVHASVFPGWRQHIRAAAGGRARPVIGPSAWGQVWNENVPLSAFSAASWPPGRFDPAAVQPGQLDTAASGARSVVGTDGEPPGCRTRLVPAPRPEFMTRATALAERPVLPADFDTGPLGARTVAIDLSKQDLGAVISRGDWESGTRFIVSGSGEHRMQPVEVRGKSLSIEFVQTAGRPLEIEPQPASFAGGRSLFTIEDGSLRLVNGRFRVPPSDRGDAPRWFLHVTDGSFSLADCRIEGPLTNSPGWEGFVRWEQRDRPDPPPDAPGRYEQYGRIARSYLCGHGTLLRGSLRGRAFVARDCILATVGDGFVLDISGRDGRIHAAVELSSCTVSAGGTFFDVKAERRTAPGTAPLRFFVEQTVFARPIDPETRAGRSPTLFRDAYGVRRQRQIEWWGQANGYASEISRFLVESSAGGAAAQDFTAGWLNVWGPAGEIRPLSAPGAVSLTHDDAPPPLRDITAAEFALGESAPARVWSADGKPIGADPALFGH
ncbi:MAG TPA: protein kinase [Planctomycetaceae bacterium]|nr:protein kinase [Planctomycetaceae bacterium]